MLCAALAAVGVPVASAATIEVMIKEIAFVPAAASAHVGDVIEWSNGDFVAHTATDKAGAWSVTLKPGASGQLKLETPGAFDYFCRYHPMMKGRINVARR